MSSTLLYICALFKKNNPLLLPQPARPVQTALGRATPGCGRSGGLPRCAGGAARAVGTAWPPAGDAGGAAKIDCFLHRSLG